MASELIEKEVSDWLDEDWDAFFAGTPTAQELIDRLTDMRNEKYEEIDFKYLAPMKELNERTESDAAVRAKYLKHMHMSEYELENVVSLDDVPDDWEPEESWNEFVESWIGNTLEEEEETRSLLESTGILDSYELVDGVYRKKSQG